jgi:hypothetical protein
LAPLDHIAAQLLFRLIAAAYERRSLGGGSHCTFEQWGRFLPEHTTAVTLQPEYHDRGSKYNDLA